MLEYIPETSVCHGERGRASTILGLDNLITTELHTCRCVRILSSELLELLTVYESIELVLWDVHGRLGLAEEGHDGLSRVSTDDWDGSLAGVLLAKKAGNKGLGPHNIEGGNAEEFLRVEHVGALEHFGGNRDGRVHRVGDDENVGLGGILGNTLDEGLYDAGVDLEEIVTGHARLA
jgi:hypothetical protein